MLGTHGYWGLSAWGIRLIFLYCPIFRPLVRGSVLYFIAHRLIKFRFLPYIWSSFQMNRTNVISTNPCPQAALRIRIETVKLPRFLQAINVLFFSHPIFLTSGQKLSRRRLLMYPYPTLKERSKCGESHFHCSKSCFLDFNQTYIATRRIFFRSVN